MYKLPEVIHRQVPPRVCIGLPVYNGEGCLEDALESLLTQTYTDFEVVICDNDSTDGTAEICNRFANRDSRIRYVRNPNNIGAAPNFNLTFSLGRSEYFKWMAHDDRLDPEYLERCVETLDHAPSSVLMVCPRRNDLDSEGSFIRHCPYRPATALHAEWEGFHALSFAELVGLKNRYIPPFIFGLARADALRQTRLIQGFIGSDRACVSELCLRGEVWQTPDFHFSQRFHAAESWRRKLSDEEDATWYDPSNQGRKVHPSWDLFTNLLIAVRRSELGLVSRLRHYAIVAAYHWGPRAFRIVRYELWWVWARASLSACQLSKVSTIPLRLWMLLRKTRRAGIKHLPDLLVTIAGMRGSELIEETARVLGARAGRDDIELLRRWAEDDDDMYRTAAKSALVAAKGGDRGKVDASKRDTLAQDSNPT